MSPLLLLPGVIVGSTATAVITVARAISRFQPNLARLGVQLADSHTRLQQAKQQRAAMMEDVPNDYRRVLDHPVGVRGASSAGHRWPGGTPLRSACLTQGVGIGSMSAAVVP